MKKTVFTATLAVMALVISAGDCFALYYSGGSGDGYGSAIGANANVATIASAANQTFIIGDAATAISPVTVTLEAGSITTADDIRVKIPSALNMTWDTTVTTATISGSASAKVSTTVSYEDSSKTLVINVTDPFAANDFITVSGLSFENFNAIGYGSLTLEIDNAGTDIATDGTTKNIYLQDSPAVFTGGSGDGFGFGSDITITWAGTTSTDWDTASNWDSAVVPGSADNVYIPNTSNQPSLGSNTTIAALTIASGATLTLNGKNLTVSGALTNIGTVSLLGSESAVSFGTMDTSRGTFSYIGDGTAGPFTIKDFGAADYYNLTINDAHATKATFQTNADLTIANNLDLTSGTLDISTNTNTLTTTGTLTVDGGTLTATSGTIDANGAVTISNANAILTAPSGTMTVAGNFTHSAGTFTHSSGTVWFDGTSQSIIGSTIFNNFKKVESLDNGIDEILTFDNTATQTIGGLLTLDGRDANDRINLVSDAPGTHWELIATGTFAIDYIDVTDSDASGGSTVAMTDPSNCVDGGNNHSWGFAAAAAEDAIFFGTNF